MVWYHFRMRFRRNMENFFESVEESWKIQSGNLPALSRDVRPRGVERFYPNEYYGIDLIIKYLLDIDVNDSLPFGLPHAVCFGYQEGWYVYGKREKVKTLIYNNDLDLRVMRARQCRGWIARLESPFSILLKILLESKMIVNFSSPNKSRLLYFPVHSNKEWKLSSDNHDSHIIELLLGKSNDYEKIDVMLPIDSIIAGRAVPFQQAGFKVVSAGSIWDTKFLCRWINLVSNYGTISTSHLGSHLFYGLLMNREVIWLSSNKLVLPRKIDKHGNLRPVMEPFPEAVELLDRLKKPIRKLGFDAEFWFGSRPRQELADTLASLEHIYKYSLKYKFFPFRPNLREINQVEKSYFT